MDRHRHALPRPSLVVLLCLVCAVAGCGSSAQADSSTAAASRAAPISPSTTAPVTSTKPPTPVTHRAAPRPRRRPQPKSHAARSGSGLAYSTASAYAVQPQPRPNSCRATGQGRYSLPDPHCTPGALNPAVRQGTINQTICVPGYTKTIRPSESVTEPEKLASMAAYGLAGRSPHNFEYDHLVSLELGGAANDPRDLWPEPGASPNPKDAVEDELHHLVCDGQLSLAQAQHVIATDWVSYAKSHGAGRTSTAPRPTPHTPTPQLPPPRPPSSSGPNKPISEINCSDFPTHAAAQEWFTAHGGSASKDVAGLDGNHNGVACESLP